MMSLPRHGLVEPINMMMSIQDHPGVAHSEGLNSLAFSRPQHQFIPTQAHTTPHRHGVPQVIQNLSTLQNPPNASILTQLQQPSHNQTGFVVAPIMVPAGMSMNAHTHSHTEQPPPLIPAPPPTTVPQTNTTPAPSNESTGPSKPKKPRKKKEKLKKEEAPPPEPAPEEGKKKRGRKRGRKKKEKVKPSDPLKPSAATTSKYCLTLFFVSFLYFKFKT